MASQPQPEYRINLRWFRPFYWPILLPIALLLALFNKISPIPFKIYALRVERIGQMAGNQEEILCELYHGLLPKEYRVFIHRDKPCNSVLMNMQKRVLPFNQWFLPLFDVCRKLGGLGISSMRLHDITGRDPLQLISKTPQHFNFSNDETLEARKQCTELGIDPDKPFISVLGRDSLYLTHIKEPTDTDSYRNVDINTFIPAMEFLADRFQVLRLGSVVRDSLKTTHPNIVDYSMSGKRTELLDVYFSAKCRFFISCGTGLDSIAACNFRLPVLYVDYIPLSYATQLKAGAIFIPKKFWHTQKNRYLTMTEIMESGVVDMYLPNQLIPLGIVVHDNTPEEILEVTQEMTSRLDGSWQAETDEDFLQEKFWSHFKHKIGEFECSARIGSSFLRQNPNWLE